MLQAVYVLIFETCHRWQLYYCGSPVMATCASTVVEDLNFVAVAFVTQ